VLALEALVLELVALAVVADLVSGAELWGILPHSADNTSPSCRTTKGPGSYNCKARHSWAVE